MELLRKLISLHVTGHGHRQRHIIVISGVRQSVVYVNLEKETNLNAKRSDR